MPPGSPVNWSETARAAQAYAYALLRGATQEQAERAATVHNPGASIPDVIQLATHARQAAQLLSAGDPAYGLEYAEQAGLASTPGATTAVYSVAVLRVRADGTEVWSTIQPQLPAGASYEEAMAAIQAAIDQDVVDHYGPDSSAVARWEVKTVIGHTPGGP